MEIYIFQFHSRTGVEQEVVEIGIQADIIIGRIIVTKFIERLENVEAAGSKQVKQQSRNNIFIRIGKILRGILSGFNRIAQRLNQIVAQIFDKAGALGQIVTNQRKGEITYL
ncbi:MAG: hypothetical protein GWN57_19615, partial [Nitrospinaceae bacterium]|nr:hypothetical protein [Nitrospinaceae bacterium]NIW60888.1 hypothetical protein [Nitrospinaceae bacterium]